MSEVLIPAREAQKIDREGSLMATALALRRIVERLAPFRQSYDGLAWFKCRDCPRTADIAGEIDHADGCAYVTARDALAAIEETK